MNQENEQSVNKTTFPVLLFTVLSVHVAAAGFFAMQGCQTRKPSVAEDVPAPAPIMPPQNVQTPPAAPPRPVARPSVPVAPVSESPDAAASSSYAVQKGDSLSKIAAKAGVSTKELAELNNITNPNSIRIGQRLLLPAHARSIPQSAAAAAPKPAAPAKPRHSEPAVASGENHTVQSGDTLGKLASRYGTTVAAFREVNKLKGDTIRVGQKLVVPKGKSATSEPAAPETAPVPAETPAATEAAGPATTAEAPAPVPAPAVTEPVMIPVSEPATTTTAGSETPFPYTVKDGDTLDSIAIKFSARKEVIVSLNNLTSESLQPGQKLLIPWQ